MKRGELLLLNRSITPYRNSLCFLTNVEADLDVYRNVHRPAVPRGRPEAPFLESLDSVLVQTEAETSNQMDDIDGAVFPHDNLKQNRALISRLASFFRILRIDAVDDDWRRNAAANVKQTVTAAATFAIDSAGALALSIAMAVAGTDTTATTRA